MSEHDFVEIAIFTLMHSVYHVNWLRAKAHVDRWREELIIVKHEMQWTIRWFEFQANLWRERSERADDGLPRGHRSYAKKQEKLWNAFQRKASERFALYV